LIGQKFLLRELLIYWQGPKRGLIISPTIKRLIGITPQVTVSFVSEAWGGRVSDKAITKESGILSHLLSGDVVLADRGFNILVAEYRAQAMLQAFTRGKSQLSAKEVLNSRELARVRLHVERSIGMVKQKYTILEGILPISFIKGVEAYQTN